MKYYLARLFANTASRSYGPFDNEAEQNQRAREVYEVDYEADYDALLWIVIAESGDIETGVYDHEHLIETGNKLHGPERLCLPEGDYTAAIGVVPVPAGSPLPEEIIRRGRE